MICAYINVVNNKQQNTIRQIIGTPNTFMEISTSFSDISSWSRMLSPEQRSQSFHVHHLSDGKSLTEKKREL